MRCCALKPNGSRCTRPAQRGIHDFYWCWQHWRQRLEANR